jgi:hypothetical protein
MSVTIPRELHEKMVREWKREYETEFGPLDSIIAFTDAEEWVLHYAKLITFWRKRTPDVTLTQRPKLKLICAHAIATNAEQSLWKVIKSKGLETEVRSQLE